MVISDKTKISIWGSDGIKYCLKKLDNKLQFHYLKITVKHGDSLMMWPCITALIMAKLFVKFINKIQFKKKIMYQLFQLYIKTKRSLKLIKV